MHANIETNLSFSNFTNCADWNGSPWFETVQQTQPDNISKN